MTIGDVLAAVSVLVLTMCSWIALLVVVTFVMPDRVGAAKERIERAPRRCAGVGAGMLVAVILFTAATMHAFVGPLRLIPLLVWGAMLAAAVTGSAGIVAIIRERTSDSGTPQIILTVRAASLYSLAGLFPVCGWMIVTPIALIVSLGASLPLAVARSASNQAPPPSDLAAVRAQ